ncbi:MAG: hypothetical protein Q8P60_14070 [Pseudorhodobacter sp.]|nr:hypothetical protein [Pseudorhodobacter sp.]
MIRRWHHLAMGGALSLALVLATIILSSWPLWQSLPADTALLRLSFTHSGLRTCRDRTPEELAALAQNMRRAQVCERRRAPVQVELDLDGTTIFTAELRPSGLSGSGPSRVYQRLELPVGTHEIAVRLRDDPRLDGFNHEAVRQITLAPAQSFAIDFKSEAGGFIFY